MDYVLEILRTIKTIKFYGGIIGLMHTESAFPLHWFLSCPMAAECSLAFQGNPDETDMKKGISHHSDASY